MNIKHLSLLTASCLLLAPSVRAQTILGTTGSYGVMAGSTVTINGTTAGTSITGGLAAAGTIAGSQAATYLLNGATGPSTPGALTGQNQTDFTKAFNGLAGMTTTVDLTGKILGTTAGATVLTPGVYNFTSTAQLTGILTLDAQNQDNAVWVFKIGSTFDTAAGSSVVFANLAANSVLNDGVFWQVGTSTTFGANTTFEGNVLGGSTFLLGDASTINHGRLLTGGANTMTLSNNTIDFVAANSGYSGGLAYDGLGNVIPAAIPEPSTYALLAGMLTLAVVIVRRRSRGAAVHA